MTIVQAPFPYHGGKSHAAPTIWQYLGDPISYCEPFAGSLAVLLNRPHIPNRTTHHETVNDADGLIVNMWRAIQTRTDETAHHASYPLTEADYQARAIALLEWRENGALDHLAGDPLWCDPVIAGWWIYVACASIGPLHGLGPWHRDPTSGHITTTGTAPGIMRALPHLANGRGVERPTLRALGLTPGAGMVTPPVRAWFDHLATRLRHVRIANGDWSRVLTPTALELQPIGKTPGAYASVYLDPPYAMPELGGSERYYGTDHGDGTSVSAAVNAWCADHGDTPHLRIVLSGFDGEHDNLETLGWHKITPPKGRGGRGENVHALDRLWLSPHCTPPTPTLWD